MTFSESGLGVLMASFVEVLGSSDLASVRLVVLMRARITSRVVLDCLFIAITFAKTDSGLQTASQASAD
jgi:hypothetical protein